MLAPALLLALALPGPAPLVPAQEMPAQEMPAQELPDLERQVAELRAEMEALKKEEDGAASNAPFDKVSQRRDWGPTAAVSIAALKKYAVQATQHAILDGASLGQISNLVEMLMDSGLLTTDHDGCFNFNARDLNSRLHLGVQLDDVEIALEKTLLEESSFYRSLVDYVKKECPRPE